MRVTVENTSVKMIIISEANIDVEDHEHLELCKRTFPGFKYKDKVFPGSRIERLSMLIHNDLDYSREFSARK